MAPRSKLRRSVALMSFGLLAAGAVWPQEAQADQITIEYWNIKPGYTSPIVVNDAHFLGFFVPVFGTTYTLCNGEELVDYTFSHPSGLTGKRFDPDKHPGWDIFGWFDTNCVVHLFGEEFGGGHPTVQTFRKGKFNTIAPTGVKTDATISFYFHDPQTGAATHRDTYAHVDLNNTVKSAQYGQIFNAGDDLGTIHDNHLHFQVDKIEHQTTLTPLDPVGFWTSGTKTCEKCEAIPAPGAFILAVFGLVGVVGYRRVSPARDRTD